ncbi:MAG: hypothetical protein PVH29_03675 [Candidatus Zixiibacteriota bacterium]|jgi:hypothetical protein
MKAIALIALIISASVNASATDDGTVASVGLVHIDDNDVDTYYNYLAAVPVFRYWDEARMTEAPLLTDDALPINENAPVASRLLVVGDAGSNDVDTVRATYGVSPNGIVEVDGDVPAVAAFLAGNWARANDVVVAPYSPSGNKAASASASYAAALASALNAPVLYTYTKRVPAETITALRRLGAKNVFVVDFGGQCDDETVEKLARDGRRLRDSLTRPADVDSLVDSVLRSQTINNLPREA